VPQSLGAENLKRATLDPQRDDDACGRAEVGAFEPVVDHSKCEGKSDCVAVCPCGVFEVRWMANEDFAKLSLFGKLRSAAHGRMTAYTPNAADCRACGLCVSACPERAIRLVAATRATETSLTAV
jgi:NAD-dependent dihydropyrimidine dehydrogenase PreA subunit